MSKQTFVANTILTAAQMNTLQANDYNQTVSTKTASYTLVASDAGTRVVMNVASANTVTVNTSLFTAGDTLVIQNIGAGTTTVTAGTATVSSAGPLTISQYGSGTLYFTSAGVSLWFPSAGPAVTAALTRIGGANLSGTSVTFSNVFSATYNNYLVTFNSVYASGSTPNLRLKIAATSIHNYCLWEARSSSYGANPNVASAADDAAAILLNVADVSTTKSSGSILITSPFLTDKTGVNGSFSASQNTYRFYNVNATVVSTASYTDFTIDFSGGEALSGIVNIYGYALS